MPQQLERSAPHGQRHQARALRVVQHEAFLLELLAEGAVTIPELGTRRAAHPPVVVLTSNRTRDLGDALKRRCLYHWIDYPSVEAVARIVRRRVPAAATTIAEAAAATARLRTLDLQKPPGVAETIDWVAALTLLGAARLGPELVDVSLGAVLKYREDYAVALGPGLAWVAGD